MNRNTSSEKIRAEKIRQWSDNLAHKGCPDEYESKKLLALFDIKTPAGTLVSPDMLQKENISDLLIHKEKISPPYVVKVCSADMLHKTDEGGVILNVEQDELPDILNRFCKNFPGRSFLIEEQVPFQGMEFIIGALIDPDFGPAVMAGNGGILTELYKDVAFRLIPCSFDEACRMLGELTVSPVFSGFRGLDIDMEQLARIISSVGTLAESLEPVFSQLDINPLVYSKNKWIALDAKLVLKEN